MQCHQSIMIIFYAYLLRQSSISVNIFYAVTTEYIYKRSCNLQVSLDVNMLKIRFRPETTTVIFHNMTLIFLEILSKAIKEQFKLLAILNGKPIARYKTILTEMYFMIKDMPIKSYDLLMLFGK